LKVGEYLDRWLSDSVRDTVRQRTYERYESIVRVHIKPAFGRLKLKALTPNHVCSLYRRKLDSRLAPRTVRYIRTTLHKALSQADSDGLVPRNAASVKATRSGKPEIWPLSPDQARKLIVTANEAADRFETLYVLALHCGLREGELLGLRWDDVDLGAEAATVQVRRICRRRGLDTSSRNRRTVRAGPSSALRKPQKHSEATAPDKVKRGSG
jgi:integrase